MKIVHICLNGPYTENWGYQENTLPKYQAKLGNIVTVIALNIKHDHTGVIIKADLEDYINQDGVHIIRVPRVVNRFKRIGEVFPNCKILPILKLLQPDIIMVHGLIGDLSALQIRKYIRRVDRKCSCIADIHEDSYVTSPTNNLKRLLLRAVRRYLNSLMFPYYKKVFYVAPSCKLYARSYYRAPEDKLELLPLGCDPEYIRNRDIEENHKIVRAKYNIQQDSILICHGGKLDAKKATKELIEAVKLLHQRNNKLELLIFGSMTQAYESIIREAIIGYELFIHYTGQLSQQEYYDVFLASDIAVFPGSESALWQHAIGSGLATLVKRHVGTEYLDLGGNVIILEDGSIAEIELILSKILNNGNYRRMKEISSEKGLSFFSYERIAQRTLDIL